MTIPVQSTGTITKFRDLDLAFTKHPITKDVSIRTGDQAVIRAVRNIVMSSFYDRPFHPEKGCGVKQLLFENMTPLTAQYIKRAIEDAIGNFEPRVSLRDVVVQSAPDHNAFNVTITFFIVNNTAPTQISLFLERVR